VSGIYFIAAGATTRNREKSLDRSLEVRRIIEFLDPGARQRLLEHCRPEDTVYAWGANREGQLPALAKGDFVVDVKNKKVIQVFRFLFFSRTHDTRPQEYIGWDSEKPKDKRRPYKYVYFLNDPIRTIRTDKAYFQRAFDQLGNQNWLVGQRRFSDDAVRQALERTGAQSIEELLGIRTGSSTLPATAADGDEPAAKKEPEAEAYERPEWLLPAIRQAEELRRDPGHLERDHEDLVSRCFECLGYSRAREIKFRRGRIDIWIERGEASIVVEVKRDWSLTRKNKDYIAQAFGYALEQSARYVLVTNGDRYIYFDRERGLGYDESLVWECQLTQLTHSCVESVRSLLRPSRDAPVEAGPPR